MGGGENQRIMFHDKTWFFGLLLKNGTRAPVTLSLSPCLWSKPVK